MRKVKLNFKVLFAIFCVFLCGFVIFPAKTFAVDTEAFYFEDFTGDYYLSRDTDGISHLKVVEKFTTIFPDYKQNKGICRMIPFTNQDNANITLPNLTESDIKITRNGVAEPIYSIYKQNNYYEVCTGNEDYVLGKQVYIFEYGFEKVVTDFGKYQELFWDTNGNGWKQEFENVKARLHFVGGVVKDYTGRNWCYVGRYGDKGSDRCEVSEISDGVQFSAKNLKSFENLTFDVEIKPESFVVPEPGRNYTLVLIMIGFLAVCVLLLIRPFKAFLNTREKARYYRGLFVKPEFTPDRNYGVAEMAEVYLGNKHDAKVAVLLDMVVNHKITLIKKGKTVLGKDKWAVKVVSVKDIGDEGMCLLRILAGGGHVSDGDEIEIKTRTANSTLVSLGRDYERAILAALKKHELVDNKYNSAMSGGGVAAVVFCFIFVLPILLGIIEDMGEGGISIDAIGEVVVGQKIFLPVMAGIFILAVIIYAVLNLNTRKFLHRTKKGLEASRYMDGLRLYIGMAEKDRLKLLQSVTGAEVTPEGVVKLYEKLLPYAAVLGLEKSWMKELEKYYKLEEVETPDWYVNNLAAYSVLNAVNTAASTVSHSSTYTSSGGSSSSGFSGGGGGGFSGGGGGGGGGGGR